MSDELEHLFTMYDGGHLNRRQLLQGLLGLGLGTGSVSTRSDPSGPGGLRKPLFRAHTINHVTIRTADVSRSKAFYQSLTGLAVRAEDKDSSLSAKIGETLHPPDISAQGGEVSGR